MSVVGLDHLAITVDDVDRTLDFYRRVLGADVLYEDLFKAGDIPVVLLQVGANRISVHPSAAPGAPHAQVPTPGSADICFRWSGPLTDALAVLEREGVAVVLGPEFRPAADGTSGESIYFRDPDGNLLELLSTEQ